MGLLSLFRSGSVKKALQRGAIVIDVRTANEFDSGKVPGSINIPVDRIPINANRILEMQKPIIFCCESGARSGQALRMMKQKGLKDAFNGGSWRDVARWSKNL